MAGDAAGEGERETNTEDMSKSDTEAGLSGALSEGLSGA